MIELHVSLGGYSDSQRKALARLAASPFTVNEHYVYTLFHLYRHFLYAGAGVRMFFDMYCLSRTVTDQDAVDRRLSKLKLAPFDRAVRTLCGILFDGNPCSDAMAEAVDLVTVCGTFGTADTYHAMKRAARSVTRHNRLRTWLSDYGFTLAAMQERYPVLKRRAWLYPVCAMHRMANGMIFKRTVLAHAVSQEHAADRKQIERVLHTMNIL